MFETRSQETQGIMVRLRKDLESAELKIKELQSQRVLSERLTSSNFRNSVDSLNSKQTRQPSSQSEHLIAERDKLLAIIDQLNLKLAEKEGKDKNPGDQSHSIKV